MPLLFLLCCIPPYHHYCYNYIFRMIPYAISQFGYPHKYDNPLQRKVQMTKNGLVEFLKQESPFHLNKLNSKVTNASIFQTLDSLAMHYVPNHWNF